ncbi:MAG: response regulator transcription factor [Ruminococcus sp.]|nr:response regulator transcription factor [Ruminococcus sp.]
MVNILVADDDKHTRMLLRAILQNANYEVITAENGEQALEVLDREHIDLVIIDIMMPKMDGYEFTKVVRDSGSTIPVLMLTAKILPEDEKQGFIVGTDDYITKPIDEEKLLYRIKALLRRAQIVNEQKIIIGDVTLDYNTLTVSRQGEVQELPQKEFLLLYKLLSYPGKIFTRIQLMDEIWGMDSETGWETVTVHIGRLRKRFEDWKEFTIETVRGLGYRAVKNI